MTIPVSDSRLSSQIAASTTTEPNQPRAQQSPDRDASLSSTTVSYSSETTVVLQSSRSEQVRANAPRLQVSDARQVAGNILQGVVQRLAQFRAQGQSSEELALRLQEAVQGFATGIEEAEEILKGQGLSEQELSVFFKQLQKRFERGLENVRNQISKPAQTETNTDSNDSAPAVDSNVTNRSKARPSDYEARPDSSLASQIPLLSPDSTDQLDRVTPVAANLPASAVYQSSRIAFQQQESLELAIETQDGDTITISFAALERFAAFSREGAVTFGGGQGGLLAASGSFSRYVGASELSIAINGEIDDEERAALEALISEIAELANAFFKGEDTSADLADVLAAFNGEELSSLSLGLEQRQAVSVIERYREVATLGNGLGRSDADTDRGLQLGSQLSELAFSQVTESSYQSIFAVLLAAAETDLTQSNDTVEDSDEAELSLGATPPESDLAASDDGNLSGQPDIIGA